MKKQWIMALALLLCLCVLTACQTSEPERFTVKTATNAGQTQQAAQTNDAENWDDLDPLAEEDDYTNDLDYWQGEIATAAPVVTTPAPTARGAYAGATPVPLDPIDLPTPTSAPPLQTFNYKTYDATKLGLSFEGPAGWVVSEPSNNEFSITDPTVAAGLYQAKLTITAERVNTQYTTSQLEEVVENMLAALKGSSELKSFSPSSVDDRSLLGAKGRYANYTGVLNDEDGTEIAGRVHVTCVEKVLYTVHITYPKVYTEGYKTQVYNKLRDTIQITK